MALQAQLTIRTATSRDRCAEPSQGFFALGEPNEEGRLGSPRAAFAVPIEGKVGLDPGDGAPIRNALDRTIRLRAAARPCDGRRRKGECERHATIPDERHERAFSVEIRHGQGTTESFLIERESIR